MINIRILHKNDAEHIVKINEGTTEDFLRQWAGRFYTYPLTKEQIIERIQNTENTRYFTVLHENLIIGMVELDFINREEKICSICRFILGEQYRNKGFGVQVIDLLKIYAFNELGMRKINLTVFDFNVGAFTCYKRAGFEVIEEEIRPNGWKAIKMEIEAE